MKNYLIAATSLLTLLALGYATAQTPGANFGFVTVGTGASGTTNVGDVNVTGAFKVNGVQQTGAANQFPGAGQSATTGLVATPLEISKMKTAAGLQMTGSASGTNFGLTFTPGTGTYLVGTATSSGSSSDVASYDVVLPPWYVAGTNITLKVGCYYLDSSSTASVHTMAAAAYLNNATAGTQGSTLIATSAQTCPITTAAQQAFTITGTTLVPGSYLTLTFSAAMTNAGGASTEYLTGVTYN